MMSPVFIIKPTSHINLIRLLSGWARLSQIGSPEAVDSVLVLTHVQYFGRVHCRMDRSWPPAPVCVPALQSRSLHKWVR